MILFTSMTMVTLYTVLTVAILLWYGTGASPLRPVGVFVRELFTTPKYMIHFMALTAVLIFNGLELKLETKLHLHTDFTRVFYDAEGGFVGGVQHLFVTPWLTPILAFMYVVVLQALLLASIGIYTYQSKSDKRMFYAVCYAVIINYAVATPFYLFFPIREVWSFDPTVRFVMLDVFPAFQSQYRPLSGLDNCFPSLHTSISVTLAMLALRSGNKRWAWFCVVSAALIIFAIFYLGIHWLTDSLGGVALGLFASALGLKLAAAGLPMRRAVRGAASGGYTGDSAN